MTELFKIDMLICLIDSCGFGRKWIIYSDYRTMWRSEKLWRSFRLIFHRLIFAFLRLSIALTHNTNHEVYSTNTQVASTFILWSKSKLLLPRQHRVGIRRPLWSDLRWKWERQSCRVQDSDRTTNPRLARVLGTKNERFQYNCIISLHHQRISENESWDDLQRCRSQISGSAWEWQLSASSLLNLFDARRF